MKKLVSMALVLVMALVLTVPAFAAGTTETVTDEKHGVTITMDELLRVETHDYYFGPFECDMTMTIYVVADNSNVTIKAMEGRRYATTDTEWENFWTNMGDFAYCDDAEIWWTGEEYGFSGGGNGPDPLGGPVTYTMTPAASDKRPTMSDGYSIYFMCESDFARLVPSGEPTQPETPTQPEQPTQPTTPAQPEQPSTPVVPDAPGTYTVKKGDTWSSICINFYGDNAQRYALQKANKFVALKEGTVITLPEQLGKAVLIAAPELAEGEVLYTVKAGDTLGKIAAAQYGKVSEYKAIFERNADRLKNANTIYEGQVIVLPAK